MARHWKGRETALLPGPCFPFARWKKQAWSSSSLWQLLMLTRKRIRKAGLTPSEEAQVSEIMNWIDEFFFPEEQHAD